jgi:hypothetical protein
MLREVTLRAVDAGQRHDSLRGTEPTLHKIESSNPEAMMQRCGRAPRMQ